MNEKKSRPVELPTIIQIASNCRLKGSQPMLSPGGDGNAQKEKKLVKGSSSGGSPFSAQGMLSSLSSLADLAAGGQREKKLETLCDKLMRKAQKQDTKIKRLNAELVGMESLCSLFEFVAHKSSSCILAEGEEESKQASDFRSIQSEGEGAVERACDQLKVNISHLFQMQHQDKKRIGQVDEQDENVADAVNVHELGSESTINRSSSTAHDSSALVQILKSELRNKNTQKIQADQSLKKATAKLQELEIKYEEAQRQIAGLSESLRGVRSDLESSNSILEKRTADLKTASSERTALETKLRQFDDQSCALASRTEQVDALKSLLAVNEGKLEHVSSAEAELRRENQTLSLQVAELKEDVRQARDMIEADTARSNHVDRMKRKLSEKSCELESLQEELVMCQGDLSSISERHSAELEEAAERFRVEKALTDSLRAELQALGKSRAQEHDELTAALKTAREQIAQISASSKAQLLSLRDELLHTAQKDLERERESLCAAAREREERDAEKQNAAKRLLVSKEKQIDELRKRAAELGEQLKVAQTELDEGRAGEKRLFHLARLQAENDRRHDVLATRVAKAEKESAKYKVALEQLNAEFVGLQKRLAKTKADAVRQSEGQVNMEYLKNVVLQYLSPETQKSKRESLVPVIATILKFDGKERKRALSRRSSFWGW